MVYSAVLTAQTVMGSSPKPPPMLVNEYICKYVDQKGSAAMLTSIQSTGVTPEVNLRITQVRKNTGEKAHRGSTLALKPRADVTRSPKQGYQWPHNKDVCPPENFLKKV